MGQEDWFGWESVTAVKRVPTKLLLPLLLLLTREDCEALITTGGFWVVEAITDVGTSLVTAAQLWDLERMLGTKVELGDVVTIIT